MVPEFRVSKDVASLHQSSTPECLVAVARSLRADYGPLEDPVPAPELPQGQAANVATAGVRELFRIWGLDAPRFGSRQWNPLGSVYLPRIQGGPQAKLGSS